MGARAARRTPSILAPVAIKAPAGMGVNWEESKSGYKNVDGLITPPVLKKSLNGPSPSTELFKRRLNNNYLSSETRSALTPMSVSARSQLSLSFSRKLRHRSRAGQRRRCALVSNFQQQRPTSHSAGPSARASGNSERGEGAPLGDDCGVG
jgi:hypothetical protein